MYSLLVNSSLVELYRYNAGFCTHIIPGGSVNTAAILVLSNSSRRDGDTRPKGRGLRINVGMISTRVKQKRQTCCECVEDGAEVIRYVLVERRVLRHLQHLLFHLMIRRELPAAVLDKGHKGGVLSITIDTSINN